MMTDWAKVELIRDIKINLNHDLKSATIYANQRNCITITVTFEGYSKSDDKIIDISKEKFDDFQKVKLIDFKTGEELSRDWATESGDPELIYKLEASKFTRIPFHFYCTHPKPLPANESDKESNNDEFRGKATFFLYGRSQKNWFHQIGAMFNLSNGDIQDTTSRGHEVCKVDLEVFPGTELGIAKVKIKKRFKHLSEEEADKIRGTEKAVYDIYGNVGYSRLV